ncbi:MAG: hypothetical protein HY710_04010 [Candidatus Latescibacteria bacterium]|nr:hypothetical protein [Candidatus Latescibacterota bacterium]
MHTLTRIMTETLLMVLWLVLVGEQSVGAGLTAQESEGQVVVVSPRVGEVIDAEERDWFKLFPNIPGFQSAIFLQRPDSTVIVRVRFLEKGAVRTLDMGIDEGQLKGIAEVLDRAEVFPRAQRPESPGSHLRTDTSAREAPRIGPGVRIRITVAQATRPTRFTGKCVSVDTNKVVLEVKDRDGAPPVRTMTVRLKDVKQVEMVQGYRVSAGRVIAGIILGGFGGMGIGSASVQKSHYRELDGMINTDAYGETQLKQMFIGALVGSLLGGITGAALRAERWEVVPLLQTRQGMIPPRREQWAFAVSWRF